MSSLPPSAGPRFHGGVVFFFLFCLLCWGGISVGVSTVQAEDQATFSWRANPQGDNVLGYRLYYGPSSRLDSDGHAKSGFSYAQYLDFARSERCRLTDSGPVCETYSESEVTCEGLYGATPKCTLHGLGGWKYFAMTAYNAQAESSYTAELKSFFGAASPEIVANLHAIYSILLK